MNVKELAERLGLPFEGNGNIELHGAAPLESAGPTDLAFAANRKSLAALANSSAGCVIVPPDAAAGLTVLRAADPRAAFASALALLSPPPPLRRGVHPTAAIAASALVDPSCEIGPHVTIGENTSIAASCRIGAGSSIAEGCAVGEGSVLYPNVTLYAGVTVGARAILHSGCVLGADGFGFAFAGDRYHKFPQVGTVVLEDDVEIGANACVDRAALGVTRIGAGTKLDNMVHIGHNCDIGRHVVIAAQTGLSGGVTVGDYAVIGGQVGIGDKARIEPRAVLGSGCGILTSKIVRGGEVVWGTPARPLKEHLQQLAHLARLPELRRALGELSRRLEELEKRS